jgi:hypothetical protein
VKDLTKDDILFLPFHLQSSQTEGYKKGRKKEDLPTSLLLTTRPSTRLFSLASFIFPRSLLFTCFLFLLLSSFFALALLHSLA